MGNESSREGGGGSGSGGGRDNRYRPVSPSKQGFGRATSNALDNTFGGQNWYEKSARPYVHEQYHQRDADKDTSKGDVYKSNMFNAERQYNIRHDIPQSYKSDGSFDRQKYVETRETRQYQEKEREKYHQDQTEKECRDEMILRNGWTDKYELQSDLYSGKKK